MTMFACCKLQQHFLDNGIELLCEICRFCCRGVVITKDRHDDRLKKDCFLFLIQRRNPAYCVILGVTLRFRVNFAMI